MAKDLQLDFDVDEVMRNFDNAREEAERGAKRGFEDVIFELVRVSSEIAPFDEGILQRSHAEEIKQTRNGYIGTVEYSVKEAQANGKHFNYALWTHEGDYKLGGKSLKRPGTTGLSGKHYSVGNKYLERPLKGEQKEFYAMIAEEIKKEIGD